MTRINTNKPSLRARQHRSAKQCGLAQQSNPRVRLRRRPPTSRELWWAPRDDSGLGSPSTTFGAAKSGAGFTFIEIMVSITILVVVSGILLFGTSVARRTFAVRSAAEQVGGFLRETADLALNGVKDPRCTLADTDAAYRTCFQYQVAFPSDISYLRTSLATTGSPPLARRQLPTGVRFASSATILFQYTPPVLAVTPSTTLQIVHAADPARRACIAVGANGTVDVRIDPTSC